MSKKFKISRFLEIQWTKFPLSTSIILASPGVAVVAATCSDPAAIILGGTLAGVATFVALIVSYLASTGGGVESLTQRMIEKSNRKALQDKKMGRDSYAILADSLISHRYAHYIRTKELSYDFADICVNPLEHLITVPIVKEPKKLRAAIYSSIDNMGITLESITQDIYAMQAVTLDRDLDADSMIVALIDIIICRGNKISDAELLKTLGHVSKFKSPYMINVVAHRIVDSIQYTEQLNLDIFRQWIENEPHVAADIMDKMGKLQPEQKKHLANSNGTQFFFHMSRILPPEIINTWPNVELRNKLKKLHINLDLFSHESNWPEPQLSELKSIFAPTITQIEHHVSQVKKYDAATIANLEPKMVQIVDQLLDISTQILDDKKTSILKELNIQEKIVKDYHQKTMKVGKS